ncbi:MAG: flagellar biosynthesis protein FlgN [Gammaproteobacteria bacterium]|jgi:flagellar biosynthesis/type III secretory pathway chaperone|nr:flagellar biosynthesis protein FlgN [Gammaproteobacteria bacterium]
MYQDARRLEDLLDREIEAARALSIALEAERAALTGAAPAAVHETAAEKVRLLGVIEALETERRSIWGSSETHAPSLAASVAERWRALMELMAGCRTANEVNGHIIHIRQHQIHQLIDIVRGGTPVTYGPQGKTFAKALRALAWA